MSEILSYSQSRTFNGENPKIQIYFNGSELIKLLLYSQMCLIRLLWACQPDITNEDQENSIFFYCSLLRPFYLLFGTRALQREYSGSAPSRSEQQRPPVLSIDISAKYHSALQLRFHSKHAQITRDLRYLRDSSRWKRVDANVVAKDVHDASKGGVLTITAPTRSLRRRVYQQILYSHPPSNDTTLRIRDGAAESEDAQSAEEWRNIDRMMFNLISSMEDADALTICNAFFISRLGDGSSVLRGSAHREWMQSLFRTTTDDVLPFESPSEMLKICQLMFSALAMHQTEFGSSSIARIFHNILRNGHILKMVEDHNAQNTVSQHWPILQSSWRNTSWCRQWMIWGNSLNRTVLLRPMKAVDLNNLWPCWPMLISKCVMTEINVFINA